MEPIIFVLTYEHNEKVEHWLRTSASDIAKCGMSWMFDNGEVRFSIHSFDNPYHIDVKHEDLQELNKTFISSITTLPDEIFVCEKCFVFTTSLECKVCNKTTNIET